MLIKGPMFDGFILRKKSDLAERLKFVLTWGIHELSSNLFTLLAAIDTCTLRCVQSCINCFICMGLLSFVALHTFRTLVTHLEISCEAWDRKSVELKKMLTNEEHDRNFHTVQFAFKWPLVEEHCSTLKVRILNYFQSLHMGCQVRVPASKACTSQINSTKYNFDFIFDVVNIQNKKLLLSSCTQSAILCGHIISWLAVIYDYLHQLSMAVQRRTCIMKPRDNNCKHAFSNGF